MKEIEKHRRQIKLANSTKLSPGQLWSPNSPCKGLRDIIQASQKSAPNSQGALPGIRISNFDDEKDNQITGKSKIVNSVKRLVGKRGRQKSEKNQNRAHIVHPMECSPSSRLYPAYNTETSLTNVSGNPNGILVSEAIDNKEDSTSEDNTITEHSGDIEEIRLDFKDKLLLNPSNLNPKNALYDPSKSNTDTTVDSGGDFGSECGMCSRTNSQNKQESVGEGTNTTNVNTSALNLPVVSNTNSHSQIIQEDPCPPSVSMETNYHQSLIDTPTNTNSDVTTRYILKHATVLYFYSQCILSL